MSRYDTGSRNQDAYIFLRQIKPFRNDRVIDLNEIFVRAHTVLSKCEAKKGKRAYGMPVEKWPFEVLVIDTESTIDVPQKLNFGVYRRCHLIGAEYRCIEEGLIYADDLAPKPLEVLRKYVAGRDTCHKLR